MRHSGPDTGSRHSMPPRMPAPAGKEGEGCVWCVGGGVCELRCDALPPPPPLRSSLSSPLRALAAVESSRRHSTAQLTLLPLSPAGGALRACQHALLSWRVLARGVQAGGAGHADGGARRGRPKPAEEQTALVSSTGHAGCLHKHGT